MTYLVRPGAGWRSHGLSVITPDGPAGQRVPVRPPLALRPRYPR